MPVYAYKGFNAAGKTVTGTQDADSPRAIKQALRRDGIFLTELTETNAAGAKKASGGKRLFDLKFITERVSSQDLAVATRQLATLVGAGIPLVDSLVALIDQVDNPAFKSIWADVKQRVNEGTGFGDALSTHPRTFSGLYVNMVRAGETSGALDVVLNRLADFTESQAELRSKLMGTMIYPVLMIIMAVVVVGILFIFVIPKIAKLFEAQKVALPLPTQILIGASSILKGYWFIMFPLMGAAIYGFQRYINSERGRPWWDAFVLDAPIFGPLVRMVAITRFTKTLSTLIGSGVPLLGAFDIVKNVVQNTVLLKVIETARDCVKEGESIAAPLKRSGQFPPIVTHMIAIGEKSGQLEEMLGNVARSYEVQVDARLRAMTSLLEPLMLVVMGVVVAFIVFSILLPMLEISSFA
jgi:general secretion pathway protein F